MSAPLDPKLDALADAIAEQPTPPGGMRLDVRIDGRGIVMDLAMGNRWMWKPGLAVGLAAWATAAAVTALRLGALADQVPQAWLTLAAGALVLLGGFAIAVTLAAYSAKARVRLNEQTLEIRDGSDTYAWDWADVAFIHITAPRAAVFMLEVGVGIRGRPALRLAPQTYLELTDHHGQSTRLLKNFDSPERAWVADVLNDLAIQLQAAPSSEL